MSYQVLARKYRPQRFADMVGQEPVVKTLANALGSGRVHHAYVFSGIRGIGKTTSARLLARALNCVQGPTAEPCGSCAACTEIAEGRSIDAIEIDAASNRGIDEVKALIQSAQYSPSRDRHKVFIVDEFHMLTREAFNALLKTLEEPPAHVVFILATTELEKVPATILSRCLLLPFRPVPAAALRDHLLEIAAKEGVRLDPEAAALVARKAGGSIRDAQSTLDRVMALSGQGAHVTRDAAADVLGVVDAAVLRGTLAAVLEGRAADALDVVGDVVSAGGDLHAFVDDLLAEARAALVVRVATSPAKTLGVPETSVDELRAVADLGSDEDLRRVVDALIEAGPKLRTAVEPRFVVEALLVRLAHLTRLEPLADVVRRLEASGAGGSGASAPVPETAARPRPPAQTVERARPPVQETRPVEPPRPAPAAPPAASQRAPGSWREKLASGGTEAAAGADDDDGGDEAAPSARPAAPQPPGRPRATRQAGPAERPLDAFRTGLPARVRGQVEHGLLRSEADGLALLLPPDRPHVAEQVEENRFHLMAAAAEAFGRPVPVRVALDASVLARVPAQGEVEGGELAQRRLQARAETAPAVQALRSRFEARVIAVHARGTAAPAGPA